ncbi:MAG: carboxypeptidase regulatory-like domain-containing protein [Dehalococcoidia bacterium]|nr:carboxypeptidase regulatory-like domain-containing protein [Dehalococcoidia bacterium]
MSPSGPYAFFSSGGLTEVRANLAPGRWYFRLLAIEGAGNESDACSYGPICLLAHCGTLTGTVFVDTDGDGRRWQEPGLSGWRVVATSGNGDGTHDVITAPDGAFALELPVGTFRVCAIISARVRLPWEPVKGLLRDGGGGCGDLAVVENIGLASQDFGFFRPGSLSGIVFRDSDSNGRLGRQEAGMAGALVWALGGGADVRWSRVRTGTANTSSPCRWGRTCYACSRRPLLW